MAIREIHVDYRHKVFARFYAPRGDSSELNLFNTEERDRVEADLGRLPERMDVLVRQGLLVEDSAHNLLVPLTGRLVLPDVASPSAAPVTLFLHGMAASLFNHRSATRHAETRSYEGYRVMQRDLAGSGVASFSINLNIVNTVDHNEDYLLRVQFALLGLMLLRRLASPYSVEAATDPLFIQRPGHSDPVPLAEALELSPPFPSRSPLQRLRTLQSAIRDKLDFAAVGLLGHSRGGNAVLDYINFLPAQAAGPAAGPVPPPQLTRGRRAINPHLLSKLSGLAALLDGHSQTDVKSVIALQPTDDPHTIHHESMFCLVVASSHDEDTQEAAMRVYDPIRSPKAMLFIHGATHNRFNAVWRRLPGKASLMQRNIDCQDPIRILSNRSHDGIALHFLAGFFKATLRDQQHLLGLITGERRAPLRIDVERAWLFGLPLAPAGVTLLDSRVTEVRNVATNVAQAITKTSLSDHRVGGQMVFAQSVDVFRIERPPAFTFRIEIAIRASDGLESATHFGFRYAKEYNVKEPRARLQEPLRNFQVALRAGQAAIGRTVAGSDIASLIHRAYPTRQYSHEVPPAGGCYDDTMIVLQTVEVPLANFLSGSRHTVTDLARVDKLIIDLLPAPAKPGNDIHCLTDIALSRRQIPPPP